MDTLIFLLIFCQALGALAGAFTAVWGEIAYIHAMRNGRIDSAEREHLLVIDKGLRFGMALLLLASFALVIVSFFLHYELQPAMTVSYWIFILFALLVIFISWALARKNISFELGSSAAFSAWWLLSLLALGWLPVASFGTAVSLYVVLTAVMYAVFHYIRLLALPKNGPNVTINNSI